MAAKLATIDQLSYLFAFPFDDPQWKRKLGLGFLFILAGFFIPLLPLILMAGYMARIMRAVIDQPVRPSLPQWDEWDDLLLRGLRVTAAWLLTWLPAMAPFILGYVLIILPAIVSGATSTTPYQDVEGALALQFGGMALGMAFFGVGLVISMALALFAPAALSHVVATDRFSALFQISQWWAIMRANLAGFLIADLLILGAAYIGMLLANLLYLSVILCCLFPLATAAVIVYIGLVASAAIGQAYRVGREKLEQA
jgi:hypothetical protein